MNLDQMLRLRNELMNILHAKQEREGVPRTLREKIAALREAYGASWVGMNISTASYPGPETGKLYPVQKDIQQPEPAMDSRNSKKEPKTSGRSRRWQRKP